MEEVLKLLEEIRDELRLPRVHLRPTVNHTFLESRQLGRMLREGCDSLSDGRAGLLELDERKAQRQAEPARPASPAFVKAVDEMIETSLARFLSQENQPGAAGQPAFPTSSASDFVSPPTQPAQL